MDDNKLRAALHRGRIDRLDGRELLDQGSIDRVNVAVQSIDLFIAANNRPSRSTNPTAVGIEPSVVRFKSPADEDNPSPVRTRFPFERIKSSTERSRLDKDAPKSCAIPVRRRVEQVESFFYPIDPRADPNERFARRLNVRLDALNLAVVPIKRCPDENNSHVDRTKPTSEATNLAGTARILRSDETTIPP